MEKLIKNAQLFKLSQSDIDAAEKERLQFIEPFPKESIKILKIEDYVKVKSRDTFTYWLEHKRILFGIGGGNASKFGIYMAKDGNYYTGSGTKKKIHQGDELERTFSSIRKGIVDTFDLTEQNRIYEIIDINIPVWNLTSGHFLVIPCIV